MRAKTDYKDRIRGSFQDRADRSSVNKENIELKTKNAALESRIAEIEANLSSKQGKERDALTEELRRELENTNGKLKIAIANIQPSDQVRRTFSPQIITERASSLLQFGQRKCLVLYSLSDNKYEIEDGEITWRAAKQLVGKGHQEYEFLDAVIATKRQDEDAHKRSLIHHRHSQSLNELDETEALLREMRKDISLNLKEPTVENLNLKFKKIICSLRNQIERNQKIRELYDSFKLLLPEERKQILAECDAFSVTEKALINFFCDWQVDNISTFYRKSLPLAFIYDDLKMAVRDRGLACRQALVLNKVEAASEREKLTAIAIEEKLSVSEIKARIKSQKKESNTLPKNSLFDKRLANFKELESEIINYNKEEKEQLIEVLEVHLALLKREDREN